MDIVSILNFLLEEFNKQKINYAIIGGLALHMAGVTRSTTDIDVLVLIDDKEKVKNMLKNRGFDLRYETADVMNFFGKESNLGRVDFIIAHRKYAIAMLARAKEVSLFGLFKARVICVEDQIGLKVQSLSSDKERYFRDMSDIEQLIRNNIDRINIELVREYFKLFKKEDKLEKILNMVRNAR